MPQTPLITDEVDVLLAEHEAVVPPFSPVQVQVHGPEPVTDVAFP